MKEKIVYNTSDKGLIYKFCKAFTEFSNSFFKKKHQEMRRGNKQALQGGKPNE